jgi:hypothetical protein
MLLLFYTGFTQTGTLKPVLRPIAMINDVSFLADKFSKKNLGNGFLINYQQHVYAATAKHIMILAKTDKMVTVSLKGELNKWEMHPKDEPNKIVTLGKLLNENNTDSLNWGYLENHWLNYPDWIVFAIKNNKTAIQPLDIRTTALVASEKIFIVGWAYKDSSGSQRTYQYEYLKTSGTHLYLRKINAPESAGGLSGAPVIDQNGFLVGIVSSSDEDPVTKEEFMLACGVESLVKILAKIKTTK